MSGRINAYRNAVVATIKDRLPQLRHCEAQFGRFNLDELETNMMHCPAVRFAVLQARLAPTPANQPDADLTCAAFVVTDGKDRDTVGWTISEAIAVIAGQSAQMFGMLKLATPQNVQILPVVSAQVKTRGVSIMAVEWKQQLRQLGDALWDDERHLLEDLYVNDGEVDLQGEDDEP